MKNLDLAKTIATLTTVFALAFTAWAQEETSQPGALKVGQNVEAEYIPGSRTWIPGEILEVVNDGYSYRVRLDTDGDGKTSDVIIHFKRVHAANSSDETKKQNKTSGGLVYGKYGCTSSKYSGGSYEYTPRGSFVITSDGKYAYHGFEKPSEGIFTIDAKKVLSFKGGYLNHGEATPIEDRPNRFYLVLPTIPDNRWTCGLVDEK